MQDSKVLLIDDDASLRKVMSFCLSEAGYNVVAAESGEEGLRLFTAESPDMVLTDIQLGGISGLEVVSKVHTQSPTTPVVVISAFGTVENAVEAMKLGACDFVPKPFSKDHLQLVVAKALRLRHLQEENQRLRRRFSDQFVTNSDQMQAIMSVVHRVAPSEATVLIQGESGTGKELVARAVHDWSDRREGPFIPVNCAAIPGELLESELFGHCKGSFTGAVRDRKGKFEQSDGGTLFLDEVGELPLELQPKLLRALQERIIEPVGGHPRPVNVRIVAATNRDLEEAVTEGAFREDLYYRLAVIPLAIPPLRQRREDISLLVAHFLKKNDPDRPLTVSAAAMERLQSYAWPGNVRELQNAVERMCLLCRGEQIEEQDLPSKIRLKQRLAKGILTLPPEGYSLEELEKEAILEALLRNDWNQTRAAAFLQIPRHVLAYRLEKFGIKR